MAENEEELRLLREIHTGMGKILELLGKDMVDPAIFEPAEPVRNNALFLQWTLSKTDLIELIYALHSSSAFNKGQLTIVQIVRVFESCFHIHLGNTSMTFQDILRRKDSTAFLERLKSNLEMHIERIEDRNH